MNILAQNCVSKMQGDSKLATILGGVFKEFTLYSLLTVSQNTCCSSPPQTIFVNSKARKQRRQVKNQRKTYHACSRHRHPQCTQANTCRTWFVRANCPPLCTLRSCRRVSSQCTDSCRGLRSRPVCWDSRSPSYTAVPRRVLQPRTIPSGFQHIPEDKNIAPGDQTHCRRHYGRNCTGLDTAHCGRLDCRRTLHRGCTPACCTAPAGLL